MGEDHRHETHLVPLVLKTVLGRGTAIKVFGTDYETPDGTCIRDYIHVRDLASAHVLALDALQQGLIKSTAYNLGNGKGYSVREVLQAAKRVTNREIPWVPAERRPGDPAVLVASSERIKRELGWKIQFTEIEEIIRTAWAWHSSHPKGYGDGVTEAAL